MSASEVQAAQKDYELARERYRLLASSLEKEDSVIIRHKPPKAAPVLIPATRVLPPALKLDIPEVPEEGLPEQAIETAVAAAAVSQSDRVPEGEPAKQASIEQTTIGHIPSLLSEEPCMFPFFHSKARILTMLGSHRQHACSDTAERLTWPHLES
jgi:hypothetical protein